MVSVLAVHNNNKVKERWTKAASVSPSPRCRHLPWLMTQQMQSLQLSQTRKCPGGPASPSAAKRLYRNLSEKLRGSTSSFEDAYFFSKADRLRKASVSWGWRGGRASHGLILCAWADMALMCMYQTD